MDATEFHRLRWRCRRGRLENDLILERFLDARGAAMDDGEAAALRRLLDYGDDELWDMIAGRTEAPDPTLEPVLEALRAA